MHCHDLVHEDHDMMDQFEITESTTTTTAMPASAPSMLVQWALESLT